MNNPADDIPQSEKRRVMENDMKVRQGSYSAHAEASTNDTFGGRFSKKVDKIDLGSPASRSGWGVLWANDPPEPPLGYEIHAQDPVGEPHEIAASRASTTSAASGEVEEGSGTSSKATVADAVADAGRVAPKFKRRM